MNSVSRDPCTFKQQDLVRALKGAKAVGIEVARIEINRDGKIIVVTGRPAGENLSAKRTLGTRCFMKTRKPYPFVHEFTDRHGRPRVYLRKRGCKRIPLPWPIGSREFVEAYQAALADNPLPIGQSRTKPGSINALVQVYYASDEWTALAPQSQRTYRHILERFRAEHGDKPVRLIERDHIKAMVSANAATPAAANKFRKLLSVLMKLAMDKGWRGDNPVASVKGIKIKSEGFKTWSEDHIAQYEAKHAIGTKARLALDQLLYTGQRRSDVVRMGKQHVRNNVLTIRQQKTGVEVAIPVHPKLKESIAAAASSEHLTFLVTEYGQPFSPAGFTNWFRNRCVEAGLPKGLSRHGLRKAMCRTLAEAGCTPHEIMAISGHKSLAEVQRYCEAANRARLAGHAMRTITRAKKRTGNGKPDA
ncbi:MAG: site-specific integrase [Methyloceanibacter sp.]